MTSAETHVLQWIRTQATRHDRVLAGAINMGTVLSIESVPEGGWRVHARSKRGVDHRLVVVQHPITGEPVRYYREGVENGRVADERK